MTGQFKIQDLNSRNSTFVNGVPVTERVLASGDEIKIGNSLFVFVEQDTQEERNESSVEYDRTDTGAGSTIILRKQDARYLRDLEKIKPTARMVRDLDALLRFSKAVNSVRGLAALEKQVLELIFEVSPAERAAILLCDQGLEEYTSVFGWDRRTGPNHAVQVSRTIVSQVLAEGVAVLCNDLPAVEAFAHTDSVMLRNIRSVLAVPLEVFERVLGVIYLDASDPDARFDEDHLQLLTAIGSLAASALDNARRMEWLEEENRRLQSEMNVEHNMVGESPRMRRGLSVHQPRGLQGLHRADFRRERHRQGTGGARHPSQQQPRQQAVRRHQLRRARREPAGKRTVRPRERRLHRRRRAEERQARSGRRRHGLPG